MQSRPRQWGQLSSGTKDAITLTDTLPQFRQFSQRYGLGTEWLNNAELDRMTELAYTGSRSDAQFSQRLSHKLHTAFVVQDPARAIHADLETARCSGVNLTPSIQHQIEQLAIRSGPDATSELRLTDYNAARAELDRYVVHLIYHYKSEDV